jgi:hypothetical protein
VVGAFGVVFVFSLVAADGECCCRCRGRREREAGGGEEEEELNLGFVMGLTASTACCVNEVME